MVNDRDARRPGTEDLRYIPADAGPLDDTVDAKMAARAKDCEANGHRWLDPETRGFCLHCAAVWLPGSMAQSRLAGDIDIVDVSREVRGTDRRT